MKGARHPEDLTCLFTVNMLAMSSPVHMYSIKSVKHMLTNNNANKGRERVSEWADGE